MEEKIVFYSHGIPMAGILGLPEKRIFGQAAVILCHGHSRHKNDGLNELSKFLVEKGFITLRFDFRGCGESGAKRFHLFCDKEWPEDLVNATTYIQTRPEVDPNRIGVLGISIGASTAVYAAGLDRRLKVIVSLAGIGDCKCWLENIWKNSYGDSGLEEIRKKIEDDRINRVKFGTSKLITVGYMAGLSESSSKEYFASNFNTDNNDYLTIESLECLLNYKPEEVCQNIENPTLFLHGEKDTLVPYSQSLNICQGDRYTDTEFVLMYLSP